MRVARSWGREDGKRALLVAASAALALLSPATGLGGWEEAGPYWCKTKSTTGPPFSGGTTGSDWIVSTDIDREVRGAIHAAMEEWNHQSTGGFFWFEGNTDSNRAIGLCTHGANLVRNQRTNSGASACGLGGTFGLDDTWGVVTPACGFSRTTMHYCGQNHPYMGDVDGLFLHEFGHVNGLGHPDQGGAFYDGRADANAGVPSRMRKFEGPGFSIDFIAPFDQTCSDVRWHGSDYRRLRLPLFLSELDEAGNRRWIQEGVLSPRDFGHDWGYPQGEDPVSQRYVAGASVVFGAGMGAGSEIGNSFALTVIDQGRRGAGHDIQQMASFLALPSFLADDDLDGALLPHGFVSSFWLPPLGYGAFLADPISLDSSEFQTRAETFARATFWTGLPLDWSDFGWVTHCPDDVDGSARTERNPDGSWRCTAPAVPVPTVAPVSVAIDPITDAVVMAWRNVLFREPAFPAGDCATDERRGLNRWCNGGANAPLLSVAHRPAIPGEEPAFGPGERILGTSSPSPFALTNVAIACADFPFLIGNQAYSCFAAWVQRDDAGWTNRIRVLPFRVSLEDADWWAAPAFPALEPVSLSRDGDPVYSASDVGLTYVPGNGENGAFYLFVKPIRRGQHVLVFRHGLRDPWNAWTFAQELDNIEDTSLNTTIRGPTIQSRSPSDAPLVLVTPFLD